ncbi:hypothetical protein [Desulfatibacillum aliphaticivorans]|uniref:hypothetical protein n=1 Tax=Desulfatibacillum aliphaticivorans TaxID=218208 RepID=UPI000400A193|nr:hypothetical protein [Desulfatibacillum aliphaticivorans]
MDHNAITAKMENNPRYQRAIQRLAAMDNRQRAILDLVAADKGFAAPGMAREIAGMVRAADQKFAQKQFAESQRRTKEAFSLHEDALDFEQGQGALAEGVGLADLVVGGALGHQQMELNQELANQTRKERQSLRKAMALMGGGE